MWPRQNKGGRRVAPPHGERFAVLGLGFLGQFSVQLLRNNGCRAIGLELRSIRPATGHYRRNARFSAPIAVKDGSAASLSYTALGHASPPRSGWTSSETAK